MRQTPTKERIISTVYDYFGADISSKALKSRKRIHTVPRQFAMYFLRSEPSLKHPYYAYSLKEIGLDFGRDHSTVSCACDTVSDLITTDKNFRLKCQEIEQLLKN